jgi:hypothetical protein
MVPAYGMNDVEAPLPGSEQITNYGRRVLRVVSRQVSLAALQPLSR